MQREQRIRDRVVYGQRVFSASARKRLSMGHTSMPSAVFSSAKEAFGATESRIVKEGWKAVGL